MFDKKKQLLEEIRKGIYEELNDTYISNAKFSDLEIKHDENSNGNTIEVKGLALFKFLIDDATYSGVKFEYVRNLKGSRKKYVTLKLNFEVNGIPFSDTVDFVDGDKPDKFYNTKFRASKTIFGEIENIIHPLLRNDEVGLDF